MDALTAQHGSVGRRQIRPMQPRLDVRPLAKEVSELIIQGNKDLRLRWNDDGSVRVLIGEILPKDSAVKQTLEGRRKRFSAHLDGLMDGAGWSKVRHSVYCPLHG